MQIRRTEQYKCLHTVFGVGESRQLIPVWHPFHSIQIVMLIRLTKFRCLATSDSQNIEKFNFQHETRALKGLLFSYLMNFDLKKPKRSSSIIAFCWFFLSLFKMWYFCSGRMSSLTVWPASKWAIATHAVPYHYATNCQRTKFSKRFIYYCTQFYFTTSFK